MLSFMIFMFLGVICVVAVLFYMLYTQERICKTLREEHAQMRLLVQTLEQQIRKERVSPSVPEDAVANSADALLELSFSKAEKEKKVADADLDLHLDIPSDTVK